jgi:hypothetical protein
METNAREVIQQFHKDKHDSSCWTVLWALWKAVPSSTPKHEPLQKAFEIQNRSIINFNCANMSDLQTGTVPFHEFMYAYIQFRFDGIAKQDVEKSLLRLWLIYQFPKNWTKLPPRPGGEYPSKLQIAEAKIAEEEVQTIEDRKRQSINVAKGLSNFASL